MPGESPFPALMITNLPLFPLVEEREKPYSLASHYYYYFYKHDLITSQKPYFQIYWNIGIKVSTHELGVGSTQILKISKISLLI